jgi:hypothetical protein
VLFRSADGIWSAIKASCILAGARTLTGALTPLVGSAPTNIGNNFVSGDYDRETGLLGNGSNKALNSNRANDADPQDSNHNAVYLSSVGSAPKMYMGCLTAVNVRNELGINGGNLQTRSRASAGAIAQLVTTGLVGHSRNQGSEYIYRTGATDYTSATTSTTVSAANILIFSRGTPASLNLVSDARIAFYSIGESLDLADLDTRVSTLITDIDAAI